MVFDIKMCRFDDVPWGFRLVGGTDFDCPFTVVKVTEGSIAEEAGLRVGDIIVRINDTAAMPLTHEEANKLITHSGNVFYFGVYREDNEPEKGEKHFPIIGLDRPSTPESFLEVGSSCRSPNSIALSEDYRNEDYVSSEQGDRPSSVLSENSERKLVEEEIAAVLSGESEVLKEHQVLGIFPKPGVCMTSDVLRTLNEEATKTKAEKDKENKKWTTFLQKPDRPIPKSKEQIEAERRAANAYKVKIVPASRRSVSPMPEKIEQPKPEPEPEPKKEATPPKPEIEEPPPTDSEVPNLEETKKGVNLKEEETADEEKTDKEKEEVEEIEEIVEAKEEENGITENEVEAEAEIVAENETLTETEKSTVNELVAPQEQQQKTQEELALERQLADVQKQLAALSNLPTTIQATLDAVTKQLADLLPAVRLQQQQQTIAASDVREIKLEKIDESTEEKQNDDIGGTNECADDRRIDNEMTIAVDKNDDKTGQNIDDNIVDDGRDKNDVEVATTLNPILKQEAKETKAAMREMEAEQNIRKQKRSDVIVELEEELERKSNPKRSKRAFGPLTPSSERPLVLPGGRRWYRPKDAYNDEFIAEVLSAQAELITGTTLGVNFMKYQKPERKIDLNRSEVYKVIHHLDRQPVRGIEVRPPVVPAEADIRKAVQS